VKFYIGAVAEQVVLISVTAVAATAASAAVVVAQHTLYLDMVQD
jgi:hypothetical protein